MSLDVVGNWRGLHFIKVAVDKVPCCSKLMIGAANLIRDLLIRGEYLEIDITHGATDKGTPLTHDAFRDYGLTPIPVKHYPILLSPSNGTAIDITLPSSWYYVGV